MSSSSTVSDEYRFIPANEPDAEFKIFQERERDLEYSIEHFGNEFYIQTNKDDAFNFKLMKTPVDQTGQENWVEVIPHREETFIEGFEIFKNYFSSYRLDTVYNYIYSANYPYNVHYISIQIKSQHFSKHFRNIRFIICFKT